MLPCKSLKALQNGQQCNPPAAASLLPFIVWSAVVLATLRGTPFALGFRCQLSSTTGHPTSPTRKSAVGGSPCQMPKSRITLVSLQTLLMRRQQLG